jgi:hypothetical protein
MSAEPPAFDQLADFTHRDYRPDHEPHPTPPGISLGPMDPIKVSSLLSKIARRAAKGGVAKGSKPATKVSHGRK